LIAVYCAACSLFPADPPPRRGRPKTVSDDELLCLMVGQMLLGQPSDRRFLAAAKRRLGHLFPRLPSQPRYNERCRLLAPKLVTLWRAIACELPGFRDSLSYADTTPLRCGQSGNTANRSELTPWCGFGYCAAHSRYLWGMRLVLWCGPDGCIRDFDLIPANAPEREAALTPLERQPAAGQLVIADKGFAGADFEQAVHELRALLFRPNRADESRRTTPPIRRIRQRIESVVNSLEDQLRLEYHLAKTPAGLLCRIAARILAFTAAIDLNWQLGQPTRALTTYRF
jgi:Transposase DDE domain